MSGSKHDKKELSKRGAPASKASDHADQRGASSRRAKDSWIVAPTPQWYSVPVPHLALSPRPPPNVVEALFSKGTALLEEENARYTLSLAPPDKTSSAAPPPPNGLSKSDQIFIQQILTSGTSADKVSALLLLVSSSPLHTKTYLEQLGSLAKKKSREESGRAIRGLVDWWRSEGGGAPNRKLRMFGEQPGLGAILEAQEAKKKGNAKMSRQEIEVSLVLWTFEDWLKKWFFELLKSLEAMSTDPLPYPRTLAVVHLSNLLRDRPEQEGNILRLLVNKVGDNQRNIASKASHHLLQILQYHPGMTPILVREVSSLVLRPTGGATSSHVRFGAEAKKHAPRETGHDHARYYGIITLNQVLLNKSQADVAGKMIDVYFQVFGDILGRVPDGEEDITKIAAVAETRRRSSFKGKATVKGQNDVVDSAEVDESESKLVAAVLTGVNRALPFAKLDDEAFKQRMDILFRITHTGTFNVSVQALMLIFRVASSQKTVSDRFYRALYASLFDGRLASSSKQALYLNLVLKALKQDVNSNRLAAFVKRLIQICLSMEVTFILGVLWIVGELFNTVPGLRNILSETESKKKISVDTSGPALPTSRPDDGGTYDGRKREPQFANALLSCLWEIVPLVNHYHPTVVFAAQCLLDGVPVPESTELEHHSLNHFLDRFVYREARKVASAKGASMMQSGVAGQDRSGRVVMKKGAARGDDIVVNSESFKRKDVGEIPVDQRFFHTYFAGKTAVDDVKSKASRKRKARKGQPDDSESSEDDDSIADLGFSDTEEVEPLPDEASDEEDEDEEAEGAVWEAMKASMPKADGDSDLGDPDLDLDDDDDLAEFDYSESDGEEGGARPYAQEDDFDEGDADLLEDEDDLIGSDEEMTLPDDADETSGKKSSKKEERASKKRKLKHLPVFGTAEDFAHLLGDSDDDGDDL